MPDEHRTRQLGGPWHDHKRVGERGFANRHIDRSYANGGQGARNPTNYHVGRVHTWVEAEGFEGRQRDNANGAASVQEEGARDVVKGDIEQRGTECWFRVMAGVEAR